VSLKKLGRYELVRVLGKGAMGIVYEGRDPNLDRRVAIKTVKVENLSEEAAAEYEHRFRTEARSAARLQHPNIVSVYDSDRDGDIAFLVMEYIQGDDLKHHLDKGVRYSLEQSLKMIRDLLSALDYAHKQGIVHRDVKPANLLIEPGGRVKLTDFGVARIQDSGEATRTQGSMVGTLKYMAPEQVQGQKIDSRADLFSVGVVLYQLLTDKRPFDGDNDFSIIHQIIGQTPPSPTSINPKLPGAIDAVVARALAKSRDERFASARDFASALQSALRRAEDVTIVPAANPLKKADPAGTGSRGLQSIAGAVTSPSTVTQEVELVYWKDIKDSTDPEEFEAFLDKFPAGIYADLARKRLRKLTGNGTNSSPDQTLLTGATSAGTIPPRAVEQDDMEATRVRTGTTPLVVKPGEQSMPAAESVPASPVTDAPGLAALAGVPQESTGTGTDFPSTITLVGPDSGKADSRPAHVTGAASSTDAAGASSFPSVGEIGLSTGPAVVEGAKAEAGGGSKATASPSRAPAPASAPVPAPVPAPAPVISAASPATRTKKPSKAVFAGVGGLVVAAIAAFALMGRGTAPADPSVGSAMPAASAASAAATPLDAASASATGSVAAVPASAVSPAASTASSAVAAASRSAASAASKPRAAVAQKPKASAPAPAPVMETARPAAVPSTPATPESPKVAPSSPAVSNAAEACRDKVFLSREFCLQEACEKPAARNHPLCVKWREEKRLREGTSRGVIGG
jgi:serine/threonine-protein kinase